MNGQKLFDKTDSICLVWYYFPKITICLRYLHYFPAAASQPAFVTACPRSRAYTTFPLLQYSQRWRPRARHLCRLESAAILIRVLASVSLSSVHAQTYQCVLKLVTAHSVLRFRGCSRKWFSTRDGSPASRKAFSAWSRASEIRLERTKWPLALYWRAHVSFQKKRTSGSARLGQPRQWLVKDNTFFRGFQYYAAAISSYAAERTGLNILSCSYSSILL